MKQVYHGNGKPTGGYTTNTTTGECTYTIPGASVTSSYNRYAQIRAIMSTWDTAVSPIFTSSQIEFGL